MWVIKLKVNVYVAVVSKDDENEDDKVSWICFWLNGI